MASTGLVLDKRRRPGRLVHLINVPRSVYSVPLSPSSPPVHSHRTQPILVVPHSALRRSVSSLLICLPQFPPSPGVIPPPLPPCPWTRKPDLNDVLPKSKSPSKSRYYGTVPLPAVDRTPPGLAPIHTPLGTHCEYIGKSKCPGGPAHAFCSPKKSKSAVIALMPCPLSHCRAFLHKHEHRTAAY